MYFESATKWFLSHALLKTVDKSEWIGLFPIGGNGNNQPWTKNYHQKLRLVYWSSRSKLCGITFAMGHPVASTFWKCSRVEWSLHKQARLSHLGYSRQLSCSNCAHCTVLSALLSMSSTWLVPSPNRNVNSELHSIVHTYINFQPIYLILRTLNRN